MLPLKAMRILFKTGTEKARSKMKEELYVVKMARFAEWDNWKIKEISLQMICNKIIILDSWVEDKLKIR